MKVLKEVLEGNFSFGPPQTGFHAFLIPANKGVLMLLQGGEGDPVLVA